MKAAMVLNDRTVWPQYRVAVPSRKRDVDARWRVNANKFVMARGVEKQISGLNYQWLQQRRDHL